VLVQLVTLLTPGRPREQALYRSIEWGAERIPRRYLRQTYGARMLIRGPHATLDALVDALASATAVRGVRAVDLLMNPHGTTRMLWFVDGAVAADEVARRLRTRLGPQQRRRLRAVFSTACYGMSHTNAWLSAGFCVATGARGIYADGLTSLPRATKAWAAGATVEAAVAAANDASQRPRQDAVAARYYRAIGRVEDAAAVDSERVVDGARTMTVTTDPAGWRPRRLPA
jgi:hypothetical protein